MDPLELYIRTGEVTLGLVRNPSGGYVLPADWFGSAPLPTDKPNIELYAMPATALLLEDRSVDIKKWIVEETRSTWDNQIDGAAGIIGTVSILRDPYSVKPFVMFYVTARWSRVDQ